MRHVARGNGAAPHMKYEVSPKSVCPSKLFFLAVEAHFLVISWQKIVSLLVLSNFFPVPDSILASRSHAPIVPKFFKHRAGTMKSCLPPRSFLMWPLLAICCKKSIGFDPGNHLKLFIQMGLALLGSGRFKAFL